MGEYVDSDGRVTRTERLTSLDHASEIRPWRRAQELTRCFLYWMSVGSFPLAASERTWLMKFLDHFLNAVTSQFGLRAEVFLQSKTAEALRASFIGTAREFSPILGWSRIPSTELLPMPTEAEIKGLISSGKQLDIDRMTPDRCYWFLKKAERKQRETFFGHGGVTLLLLKCDPNAKPPELPFPNAVLRRPEYLPLIAELEKVFISAFAMKDEFLSKSKQLFGKDFEEVPGCRGVPFILPRLRTQDFFDEPAEECEKWFQLFEIYVTESPADRGMLLASSLDLEKPLIRVLNQLREEGLIYPER